MIIENGWKIFLTPLNKVSGEALSCQSSSPWQTIVLLIAALIVAGTAHGDQAKNSATVNIVFSDKEKSLLKLFGPWPMPMPEDAGNELSGQSWAQALGNRLFSDTVLSGNQLISCASCHQQESGFSDGLPVAQGVLPHFRNTQGLVNVGYQRWFGWDGGADSLWAASLRPMLADIEMNGSIDAIANRLRNTHYFIDAMEKARYEVEAVENEQLVVFAAKSLAAFQRTLVSTESSFDRYLEAVLNDDVTAQHGYPVSAKRGMKLFFGEANCHVCHFGPNFSNGEFHDIGRSFFTGVGKVDPGRFHGIKRVRADRYNLAGDFNTVIVQSEVQKTTTVKSGQVNFGQWRTPGLRNLINTAPYMHDGSIATLREVVDSYADIDPARLHTQGESILKPQDWSEQDREDLVDFLKSLSK